MKTCSKCKITKEIFEFNRNKNNLDGYQYECKLCNAERISKYMKSENNRKKRKEYLKKYKLTERGQKLIKEAQKKYYSLTKNKEKIKKRKQRNYFDNKEIFKMHSKINQKKQVKNLDTCYIKSQLMKRGFSKEIINQYPELIKIKQLIIKTKRLCKTSQS
jgi:hypothetical protein